MDSESDIEIAAPDARLEGVLAIPKGASSIVIFAHGSGSSRHSPRNRAVARALNGRGLATLLFDLLTAEEEARDRLTAALRFDVALLTRRLRAATEWIGGAPVGQHLRIGYFGSSTGAAAALRAAAELPGTVEAVVSRGGRPDLAGDALPAVEARTLLVVGGADEAVIELNMRAMQHLRCEVKLEIVPGATHLFEEPGALDRVAALAGSWFLGTAPRAGRAAPAVSPG